MLKKFIISHFLHPKHPKQVQETRCWALLNSKTVGLLVPARSVTFFCMYSLRVVLRALGVIAWVLLKIFRIKCVTCVSKVFAHAVFSLKSKAPYIDEIIRQFFLVKAGDVV